MDYQETKGRLLGLKTERRELLSRVKGIESELLHLLNNFNGSVEDALKLGLVKLNFPAPVGYLAHLRRT
jgi:hypothetical protein